VTKADSAKLRDIFGRLRAAETQPDYEMTYLKLVAEAKAVCANDPHRGEFLETLTTYHPDFVASRLKMAREREQQERDQTVPAA